jgi:hypothetical protein
LVLDLIVTDTGDGFTAEIPSISGCECWDHNEEEAIKKNVELMKFYLNLDLETKIKIDKARRNKNRLIYKVIFNK